MFYYSQGTNSRCGLSPSLLCCGNFASYRILTIKVFKIKTRRREFKAAATDSRLGRDCCWWLIQQQLNDLWPFPTARQQQMRGKCNIPQKSWHDTSYLQTFPLIIHLLTRFFFVDLSFPAVNSILSIPLERLNRNFVTYSPPPPPAAFPFSAGALFSKTHINVAYGKWLNSADIFEFFFSPSFEYCSTAVALDWWRVNDIRLTDTTSFFLS
jgi:hypothetical protein